jgi:hypothetical protein
MEADDSCRKRLKIGGRSELNAQMAGVWAGCSTLPLVLSYCLAARGLGVALEECKRTAEPETVGSFVGEKAGSCSGCPAAHTNRQVESIAVAESEGTDMPAEKAWYVQKRMYKKAWARNRKDG